MPDWIENNPRPSEIPPTRQAFGWAALRVPQVPVPPKADTRVVNVLSPSRRAVCRRVCPTQPLTTRLRLDGDVGVCPHGRLFIRRSHFRVDFARLSPWRNPYHYIRAVVALD